MEVQEICEKLDEKLLDFFSVLGEFYQEQAKMEQFMRDGYLNLSRARYSMGVNNVGSLQLPDKDMNPLMTVNIPDEKNIKFEFQKTSAKNSKKTDETLRKRTVGQEADNTKVETVGKDVQSDEDRPPVIKDPIKWFGVLVPQALKRSQTSFQEAANFAVTVANLKYRLATIRKDYRLLLKKKAELLASEA